LKKSIIDKLRDLQEKLDALPKAFDDNPQAHLLFLCNAFQQDIDDYTGGKPQYDPNQRVFLQDAAICYRSLQNKVRKTKPEFIVPPSLAGRAPCIPAITPPLSFVSSVSHTPVGSAPSSPNEDSLPPKYKDPIQG
jgi:hypothetical protein